MLRTRYNPLTFEIFTFDAKTGDWRVMRDQFSKVTEVRGHELVGFPEECIERLSHAIGHHKVWSNLSEGHIDHPFARVIFFTSLGHEIAKKHKFG